MAPGVLRLVAPNPSPMTGDGTNTYVLGRGEALVVDPGPDDPGHSALAPRLGREAGAPVLAWGGAGDGQRPLPPSFAAPGGADEGFRPDRRLGHGDAL